MVSMLMIIGSIALVGGGVGYFTFPMGLKMGLKSMINLKETGLVYPIYVDPPFGGNLEFYLYAIKNPRGVLKGEKMQFETKGPYAFNTRLTKDNISFSNKGEKIGYDSHRKLYSEEQKSSNFDEKMWLLNPILPVVHRTVRTMIVDRIPFQRVSEPIVFNAVNVLLDTYKERLMTKTTPRELLEGRVVVLLESLLGLADRFGLSSFVPAGPPKNTFGIAFVQNETVDRLEIWTGTGSTVDKFGDVSKWRGKSKMSVWDGEKCNIISGTNGELYKPLIEEGKPLRIFLYPFCRTLSLDPVSEGLVTLNSGIKAYEYELTPKFLLGVRSHPPNRCYCVDKRAYDCQFDGLSTMGPCYFDTPIFFARGNLNGLDKRMRNLVDDEAFKVRPTPDSLSFFLEPITGTVVKVNITFQAVIKMVKQPYMRDLSKVQNLTYAPLFAAYEYIDVPFEAIWQIFLLQKMVDYYKPAFIVTGLSGLATIVAGYMMK